MKRSTARRLLWRTFFHLSAKRVIHGVEVRVFMPSAPREDLFTKVGEALDILDAYAPQHLVRLRRLGSIIVFGHEGPSGEWHQDAQLLKLAEWKLAAPATASVHVSATIVHEVAHAWLDDRGVEYRPEDRRRIEAICCGAEARFAARIPQGAELAKYYRECANRILSSPDSVWSDDAFRERDLRRLSKLETAPWLVAWLRHSLMRRKGF